jgi:hypothetical protein
MYISRYVFYKVQYPKPGEPLIKDIRLEVFDTPQAEHSKTRKMREQGFKTLRVNEHIYKLMLAAQAAQPI